MLNTFSANVRTGKLPLRTFVVFGIVLLAAVVSTWWIAKNYYQQSNGKLISILESTLLSANVFIDHSSKDKHDEMQVKLYNPQEKEKAEIWKPLQDIATENFIKFYNYTNEVKQLLEHQKLTYSIKEKQQLLDSVAAFSKGLKNIIPEDRRPSFGSLPIEATLDSSNENNHWLNAFLKENDQGNLKALITKLQFEASYSLNVFSDFCIQHTQYVYCGYDNNYDVLINQNSTHFISGQTLEITAGVGTYSSSAKPEIYVDGMKLALRAEGNIIFKKKVKANGSVPVSVAFKDPTTGEMKTKSTNVTYTVFQPPKN